MEMEIYVDSLQFLLEVVYFQIQTKIMHVVRCIDELIPSGIASNDAIMFLMTFGHLCNLIF